MGLASAWSVALRGVDGIPVEIEADVGVGMVKTQLLGLPDAALHESTDRVKAAIRNSGKQWPNKRVTLSLSPANLPKSGSAYDLAIACVVLAACGIVPADQLADTVLIGELALNGRVRTVPGLLPALLAARQAGLPKAIVPAEALTEAGLVNEIQSYGAQSLSDVITWLSGDKSSLELPTKHTQMDTVEPAELADVIGQPEARWALEVAAAGGHHLLFTGPPGTGKTMLAQRLAGLLPPLSIEESLSVTAVHSTAGLLSPAAPLVTSPPFVSLHHSTSVAALVGGGTGLAQPGAVSRAHCGVLFLDEACEFGSSKLEALRTALEEGEIRIARKDGIVRYPARFQLVLATNTCPCAPPRDIDCVCSPSARRRYIARLSGPLLDRVDLRVSMQPLSAIVRVAAPAPETTSAVRQRVVKARERATRRWSALGYPWRSNAEVPGPVLRRDCALPASVTAVLDKGLAVGALTGRGADRCLRVAWTLADLAEADQPDADHVAAALRFRERRPT